MFYIRAHLYMRIAFVNTALWCGESFQTQQNYEALPVQTRD